MNTIYSYLDSTHKNHFKVDYPYYGLFGTAEVTMRTSHPDKIYECRLKNGTIVLLKKIEKRWIDTLVNGETPLAAVLGTSIDDFLRS
jgi:hypothetical protein